MIANCASCKHYEETTDPRGWCLLKKEVTHWQRELTCHEPLVSEKPEPMRQYPPTGEAVLVGMFYRCATCNSLDISATKCHSCGLALVVRQ